MEPTRRGYSNALTLPLRIDLGELRPSLAQSGSSHLLIFQQSDVEVSLVDQAVSAM